MNRHHGGLPKTKHIIQYPWSAETLQLAKLVAKAWSVLFPGNIVSRKHLFFWKTFLVVVGPSVLAQPLSTPSQLFPPTRKRLREVQWGKRERKLKVKPMETFINPPWAICDKGTPCMIPRGVLAMSMNDPLSSLTIQVKDLTKKVPTAQGCYSELGSNKVRKRLGKVRKKDCWQGFSKF